MSKKVVRTTVSLPASIHSKLADLAEQHDVSVAWIIRRALTNYLEETESKELVPLMKDRSFQRENSNE